MRARTITLIRGPALGGGGFVCLTFVFRRASGAAAERMFAPRQDWETNISGFRVTSPGVTPRWCGSVELGGGKSGRGGNQRGCNVHPAAAAAWFVWTVFDCGGVLGVPGFMILRELGAGSC